MKQKNFILKPWNPNENVDYILLRLGFNLNCIIKQPIVGTMMSLNWVYSMHQSLYKLDGDTFSLVIHGNPLSCYWVLSMPAERGELLLANSRNVSNSQNPGARKAIQVSPTQVAGANALNNQQRSPGSARTASWFQEVELGVQPKYSDTGWGRLCCWANTLPPVGLQEVEKLACWNYSTFPSDLME